MATKQQELRELYQKLSEQYHALVEKNQNDLIKIRQKQKTFKQTIQSLKNQQDQLHVKYKTEVNALTFQIQQLKKMLEGNNQTIKVEKNINSVQSEKLIQNFKSEKNKLASQNMKLTASNQALQKSLTEMQTKYESMKSQLSQKIQQLESKVAGVEVESSTNIIGQIICEKSHQQAIKELEKSVEDIKNEINQKNMMIQSLQQKIGEYIDQIQMHQERDRRNNTLVKKKNQEIEDLARQMEGKKNSCGKCKQWEEENQLLKEMVKSAKTMVKVRQMELQKYKK